MFFFAASSFLIIWTRWFQFSSFQAAGGPDGASCSWPRGPAGSPPNSNRTELYQEPSGDQAVGGQHRNLPSTFLKALCWCGALWVDRGRNSTELHHRGQRRQAELDVLQQDAGLMLWSSRITGHEGKNSPGNLN